MNLPSENKMLMARNRIEMNSMHKLCCVCMVVISIISRFNFISFFCLKFFFWRKRYFFFPPDLLGERNCTIGFSDFKTISFHF